MFPTSSPSSIRTRRMRRVTMHLLLAIGGVAFMPAQGRAQPDTSYRGIRYVHNVGYAATLGFLYAGVDQLRENPSEWGKGWSGYGNRLTSNIGEFVIQETVTDLLSTALHRPVHYVYCPCTGTTHKVEWALNSALTDVMPDGRRTIALPRIIGAYAGSFGQASWLPTGTRDKTQTALLNGTVSLLIGAGIHVVHELRSSSWRAEAKPNVAER